MMKTTTERTVSITPAEIKDGYRMFAFNSQEI